MANPLLDFVMSVVRDPDAAARYAADPSQAHPRRQSDRRHQRRRQRAHSRRVSESLSMAVPSTGAEALVGDPAGNVWTSGAATAAFDAFGDDVVGPGNRRRVRRRGERDRAARQTRCMRVLTRSDDAGVPTVAGVDDPSTQFTGGIIDDAPLRRRGRRHRLAVRRRRRSAPPGRPAIPASTSLISPLHHLVNGAVSDGRAVFVSAEAPLNWRK